MYNLTLEQQILTLQKENKEMKALNKSLHNLMISGENRGIAKGQEERDSLKSQVEELKVRNYALDGAMQDWQDISESLKSALESMTKERDDMRFSYDNSFKGAEAFKNKLVAALEQLEERNGFIRLQETLMQDKDKQLESTRAENVKLQRLAYLTYHSQITHCISTNEIVEQVTLIREWINTPRTDAAMIERAAINNPPNSGAGGGSIGFEFMLTTDFAKALEFETIALQTKITWLEENDVKMREAINNYLNVNAPLGTQKYAEAYSALSDAISTPPTNADNSEDVKC